jgi:hypothetical protein
MVDVRTQQQPQPELTGRQKARAVRLKLLHENSNAATVQVYAGSEEIHALLKHPNGLRLRGEFGTASEWPYDKFTQRRIADGTLSAKAVKDRPKVDPKMSVREAAMLLRPKPEDIPPVQPLSAVTKDNGRPAPSSAPPPKM